jgi:Holliday junction resolvase RusA-like endonuclease
VAELASPRPPVTITVHGRPAPQGSKRAFMGKRTDGTPVARVIESSHDRVKSWRQAVIDAAGNDPWRGPPLTGPLEVSMRFWLPRPKGHYRTGRNAHLLRDAAPAYPHGTPDLSKLCRATEDALSDIAAWDDDAQVVRYHDLEKAYTDARLGHPAPGAVITIRQLT